MLLLSAVQATVSLMLQSEPVQQARHEHAFVPFTFRHCPFKPQSAEELQLPPPPLSADAVGILPPQMVSCVVSNAEDTLTSHGLPLSSHGAP